MKTLAIIVQTFYELKSKATLAFLLGVSTIIILGVLVGISTDRAAQGTILLLFGKPVSPPLPLEQFIQTVNNIQSGLVGGLYAGLVLFGVFATAGIIPDALERGTVDLIFSKPIARWELYFGKYLGAGVVVFGNVLYFIGLLWLIFGVKTGVWNIQFLVSALTMTFSFLCLYSLVASLGVLTRNTAIAIIGAFLYLFVLSSMLEHRVQTFYLVSNNPTYRSIIDGLYYILPQISAMQTDIQKQIINQGMDWRPFAQSLLSAAAISVGGMVVLGKKDF